MIQFKHAKNKKVDIGDEIYHVINRSNARVQIFDDVADYKLFETILEEAVEKFERMVADPISIISYLKSLISMNKLYIFCFFRNFLHKKFLKNRKKLTG